MHHANTVKYMSRKNNLGEVYSCKGNLTNDEILIDAFYCKKIFKPMSEKFLGTFLYSVTRTKNTLILSFDAMALHFLHHRIIGKLPRKH